MIALKSTMRITLLTSRLSTFSAHWNGKHLIVTMRSVVKQSTWAGLPSIYVPSFGLTLKLSFIAGLPIPTYNSTPHNEIGIDCHALIETVKRRRVPGEMAEQVEAQMQTIVDQLSQADPAFKAEIRRGMVRTPLETPEDAEIVRVTESAGAKVLGHPLEKAGAAYWTDAATLWAAGIPALLLGPAGEGAHAMEAWVDPASVEACARIYSEVITAFCA